MKSFSNKERRSSLKRSIRQNVSALDDIKKSKWNVLYLLLIEIVENEVFPSIIKKSAIQNLVSPQITNESNKKIYILKTASQDTSSQFCTLCMITSKCPLI